MEIKDLVSKVFDMKILRGIARLNPELGRFCEEWGEGGMGRLNDCRKPRRRTALKGRTDSR